MIEYLRRRPAAAAAAALVLLALVAGAVSLARQPAAKPATAAAAPLVGVAKAQVRDLPLKLAAQGHLVALTQVDVRPQATGTIRSIHFREGDDVKAGQLLFTIDASDVAAQLAKSSANAAQVQATLVDAQRDLARTQQLARSRFYSSGAVDTSASKVEALQAQHRAALADVDSTRVLVDHTRIVAPMSGLTGALSVHVGSLAQPAATAPLVNVAQIDPIGVEFTLPEASLAPLLAARAAGKVQVSLLAPDGKTIAGRLVFINNTVNVDTGTIGLKAAFSNAGQTLWPGAYVKVEVVAGASQGAVTLPPQAVQEGPKGRFVFVLDAQGRAVSTPVRLLRVQDEVAVVDGLAGGETVIVEGQIGLKPGSTVRVASRQPAASKSAP